MATYHEILTDDIKTIFINAQKLSDVDSKYDPDTEPFKSKYEARKMFSKLYENVMETHKNDQDQFIYSIISSALNLVLGNNYIDTEETSTGEELLIKCIDTLEEHSLDKRCCAVIIEAYNNLGILYSSRSLLDKSLTMLSKSEKLYISFKHDIGGFPYLPYEMFDIQEQDDICFISIDKKREDHFEETYTHTLYYIAQVHASLENNSTSASYCHETLHRQLKSFKYDPIDWAMNAAGLSQYYMIQNQFNMARHCLASSMVILTEEGEPQTKVQPLTGEEGQDDIHECEKLPRAWANLYRCFVKYGLSLMSSSKERLINELSDYEKKDEVAVGDHNADKKQSSSELNFRESSKEKKPDLYFDLELTRAESLITDEFLLTFDDARIVFLQVQAWLNSAKEYYTIDEHCSDYIEIIQDNSKLYQQLSFFEMDFQRQCQMHKKRVDLLQQLNKELNPQYFLMVNRQLLYEMAEIYMAILDLKLAIVESNQPPTAHCRRKINQLAEQSIKQYDVYLETLKETNKIMPEKFADEDERPALVAWFCMGRLYSKFMECDPLKRISNVEMSMEYYKKLVDYCNKHSTAKTKMTQEFAICEEMIDLLPAKIRHISSRILD